jgi:hypothetical protein
MVHFFDQTMNTRQKQRLPKATLTKVKGHANLQPKIILKKTCKAANSSIKN